MAPFLALEPVVVTDTLQCNTIHINDYSINYTIATYTHILCILFYYRSRWQGGMAFLEFKDFLISLQ